MFFVKTVDQVLKKFNTAITELEDVAKHHEGESLRLSDVIIENERFKDAADREASKARTVVGRMKAVFQVEE